MAQGEYVGKRVTATIPVEVHEKLIYDAKNNGMRPSTRAAQILALYYNGQLSLNGATISVPTAPSSPLETNSHSVKVEVPVVVEEETNTEDSLLGKGTKNVRNTGFGRK